ncbi:MAG TPA: ABC transporter permease [Thermoanaerobaculia bacterium]|jgi:putative ABC transport system permease protein|nr:ABC transporter permease [Thermoanaerobaculia bacterium]
MQLGEAIRTSYEETKAHPLRSVFTLLGVILGTLALVVVMSVLDGVNNSVMKGLNDLGLDGVVMASQREPVDPHEKAKAHLSRGMRVEDLAAFDRSDNIETMAPVGETRAVVTAGTVTRRIDVYGVTPAFAEIRNRTVTAGRFISGHDVETSAPVVVIGFKLKNRLFGGEDALGRHVNLGGRRLTVIGVGKKFETEFVNDDDFDKEMGGVYIPWTIYRDMFGRANAVSYMLARSVTPEKSVEAEYEASARFRQAHNGIGDTRINNIGKEILKERAQVEVILRNWRIVFFAIAGVSLLIGGVGIFSVLKISISERLFEIGLRKSMGATNQEIFVQFLVESVSLSIAGALVGLALGVGAIKLIGGFFPAGLPVSSFGIMISTGFAVSVGLFAGLYPSLTAARLEPIEALRV